MADKKNFANIMKTVFFALFLLFISQSVWAQNRYRMLENSDGTITFIQRLEWNPVSYAVKYLVLIEKKQDKDVFVAAEKIETSEPWIECTLPAGNYRYKVQVINVLGRPDTESEWTSFTIQKAVQPQVLSDPVSVNLSRKNELVIRGKDLHQDAFFFLVNTETGKEITIKNAKVSADGKTAIISLNGLSISDGTYEVRIENPGGFTTVKKSVIFSSVKKRNFSVSAGYSPSVFPGEETFGPMFFEKTFFPAGFSINALYSPLNFSRGSFGVGLFTNLSWLFQNGTAGGAIGSLFSSPQVNALLTTLNLQAVYQCHILPEKLIINVQAGAGMTILGGFKVSDADFGLLGDPLTGVMPSVSAGISLQYIFPPGCFISAGVDYVYMFNADVSGHCLLPGIFFGWRF